MTPWTSALQAYLCFTMSWSLFRLMSIESMVPSSCLIFCCPLLLETSVFPRIRVFSSELTLHIRWPEYWSFNFSISPYSEYSGLISIRVDLFDLLAVQRTLRSLLQHHSMKTSVFWCSAFLMLLTLTSIHDCWRSHRFDYTDPCQKSDVSAFQYAV